MVCISRDCISRDGVLRASGSMRSRQNLRSGWNTEKPLCLAPGPVDQSTSLPTAWGTSLGRLGGPHTYTHTLHLLEHSSRTGIMDYTSKANPRRLHSAGCAASSAHIIGDWLSQNGHAQAQRTHRFQTEQIITASFLVKPKK